MILGNGIKCYEKGLVSLTCNCTAKESYIQVVNFCIHHRASCFVFRIMLNMALLLRVVSEGENVVVNQVAEEVIPSVEYDRILVKRRRNRTFPSTKASPRCIQPYLVFYKLISLLLSVTALSD